MRTTRLRLARRGPYAPHRLASPPRDRARETRSTHAPSAPNSTRRPSHGFQREPWPTSSHWARRCAFRFPPSTTGQPSPIARNTAIVGSSWMRGVTAGRSGGPYRLSRTPVLPVRPAPRLGEYAVAIAAEADSAPWSAAGADPATPFADVKVLDLSTFWAGAYLTCYLGAFGADIMKVESIQRPDGHRYSGA